MRFFTKPIKRSLAKYLIVNMILPLLLVIFLAIPVYAEELTKDDAYKGLLIAALLVIVAKVAKLMLAEQDTTPGNNDSGPPPYGYTAEDLEILAKVIYAESRGEPYEGQVAVGAVVINRVNDSQFPNTIRGVVYAPNQFTSVSDGQINLTPNATAYKAAKEAMAGKDPTFRAIYFYNPKTARNKDFFKRLTVTVEIGNHVFLK